MCHYDYLFNYYLVGKTLVNDTTELLFSNYYSIARAFFRTLDHGKAFDLTGN